MLFALATLVAGWPCPELKLGSAIRASVPVEAVCLVSNVLPTGHAIEVSADSGEAGARLCLQVEAFAPPNAPPAPIFEQQSCGADGHATLRLSQPSTPHTYVIMPRTSRGGLPSSIYIRAIESTTGVDGAASTLAPGPSPTPINASPPSPPNLPDTECVQYEKETLEECQVDISEFCLDAQSTSAVFDCLDQHRNELSAPCQDMLRRLDDCLITPHLLVPMAIASMLLLATASIVLLCTLLRCCRRYVCAVPIHIHDDVSTVHDEEILDDDDLGSVTPLPSGVKMMETPQQEPSPEDDEDELPAYTDVVQGASIARPAASSPTSPKSNYRPDVQLQ